MFKRVCSPINISLFGLFAILALTYYFGLRTSHQRLQQQADIDAQKLSQYINSELSRFQHIPHLLTSHYLIRQSLSSAEGLERLNQLLLDITKTSGANDVYVMDNLGTVVAASNYGTPQSFIGGNYAFRDYFQQALAGNKAVDYALGLRTGERGIYFSAPITINQQVKGVVTVKVSIAKFEQDSDLLAGDSNTRFLVYGDDNVVFLSNYKNWRLKQLGESKLISWHKISASQRYLGLEQTLLRNQQFNHPLLDTPMWRIQQTQQALGDYFYQQASIPMLDLTLLVLLPDGHLIYEQLSNMALAGLLYLLSLGLVYYLSQRIIGYNKLIYTRNSLERQVALRSAELANAQDALIRTAKLATIGQLAASINHEINQPLSAMSTYLVSTQRMLNRGMEQAAKDNLQIMASLITRIHKIVSQLKEFSKPQGQGQIITSLQESITNALIIVGPQINSQGVQLSVKNPNVKIHAEPLKFEQVLVNLLSNGVDAMTEVEHKHLTITCESDEKKVWLRIQDTGKGLDLQTIDTIFEPFYTTKSEYGLGLGLAISRSIIHSFDGELTAENSATGGAIFTIELNRVIE
ncbi:ATP-binding protein [Motilimonas sp. E26]|uniref:sensor histidine kinase n=1 Tax=Motilimonas sp. E26 TaxID=2865674 RepID=UPI001E3A6EFB|nr:ATP-binding protein [Motilimonas sp. E26]MCE0557967.1 GHKL domain-containing protein [Motilimonas sp. E26]